MEILYGAIPIVLGIGVVWAKVGKVLSILKEITELLVKITSSLEDKKLTPEEVEAIKKEAMDVSDAVKALVKK